MNAVRHVPCHNCEERHTRCHASCERYAEYQQEQQKVIDSIRKENDETNFFIGVVRRGKKQKTTKVFKSPKK